MLVSNIIKKEIITLFERRNKVECAIWVDIDVNLRWNLWEVSWRRSSGLWAFNWWCFEVPNDLSWLFLYQLIWLLSDYKMTLPYSIGLLCLSPLCVCVCVCVHPLWEHGWKGGSRLTGSTDQSSSALIS